MKKKLKILLFIFVIAFIGINTVNAKQVITLKECEYTEEYKKWSKLSKKEKEKVLMPQMCKINNMGSALNTNIGSALGSVTQTKFDLSLHDKNENENKNKYVTDVENQTVTGSCWAFATNASIESNLLVNGLGKYDLSETHMELSTQNTFPIANRTLFKRSFNNGGNYFVSSAYLLNRRGSVLEDKYPHSISEELVNKKATTYDTTELVKEKAVVGVSGVARIFKGAGEVCGKSSPTTAQIKQYLVTHGAIAASMYYDESNVDILNCDEDLNCTLKSDSFKGPYYYYSGTSDINHAVTIVGWDDTIEIEKFNENNKPSTPGAWIVKNSYGEYSELEVNGQKAKLLRGNGGYYYVSYEDKNICSNLAGFYDADIKVSDNSYSTSELGFTLPLELSDEALFSGAIYTKSNSSNQKIDKIAFGSGIPGMAYEIYFADNGSFDNLTKIAEGTTKYSGYESVALTNDIIITSDKFSVAVKYTNVAGKTYLPVSVGLFGTVWEGFTGIPNTTYLSTDGLEWIDTADSSLESESAKLNTVMHVYTDDVETTPTTTKTTTRETTNTTSNTTKTTTTSTTEKENDKPNEGGTIVIEPNEKNNGTVIQTEKNEKNPSTSQNSVSFVLIFGLTLLGIVGLSILKLRKLKD